VLIVIIFCHLRQCLLPSIYLTDQDRKTLEKILDYFLLLGVEEKKIAGNKVFNENLKVQKAL